MTAQLADGAEMAGFRIESLLGRGGMASVYLAHDLRLGRKVALKVLSPELAANKQFRQRFHRESRLLASLDHPNIVPVYEAGESGGLLYIAMRYVGGSDLDELLDREGRLAPAAGLHVLLQVSAALQAAHEAGLVHRDIKPANVLVTGPSPGHSAGHAYLTDFGLTKQLSSLTNLTAVGNVMGTLQYLAPEQIAGRPVDARSDIYALGGLAFRCLTGHAPFERDDNAALLWAHLSDAAPPVSELVPDVSEEVDDVIWTAMAKEPQDRFPSAEAFAEALTQAMGTAPAAVAAERLVRLQAQPPVAGPPVAGPPVAGDAGPGATGTDLPRDDPPRGDPRAPVPVVEAVPPGAGPAGAGPAAEPPAPPPTSRPAARGGSGRGLPSSRLLLGGLALLAVVAASVFALTRGGSETELTTLEASANVPFAVDVPTTWTPRGDGGTRMVMSPQSELLYDLVVTSGSPETWDATWDAVQSDASSTVGLYTFYLGSTYDPATQVVDVLTPLLPARASFSVQWDERTVDGIPAYVREGDLINPADSGQRLHFQAYVLQRDTGDARSVHLVFLAPPDEFDSQRAVFDQVAESVDFP